MAGGQNVLVVCRGLGELDLLQGLQPQPGCRYIVASDDLCVHLEVEKYSWVSAVDFLEQMESFHTVAQDALKYLALINQWLQSLGEVPRGIPGELLFWVHHSEAALTTQRIQELLLLIRSYDRLLEAHEINSVILLAHPQAEWEDEIFLTVSRSRGLQVKTLGGLRPGVLQARLRSILKFAVRDPYYLWAILRAQLSRRARPPQSGAAGPEIVFQICSSEKKHSENVLPLMKALKKRGYSPVALHWRASEANDRIRQEGLSSIELETFVPPAALGEAPYRVWWSWRQARRRRQEFLDHPGLKYRGIALGPLLWPWMRAFFWEELPQRYRLQQAAQRYCAAHSPAAIRAWGGGVLAEGAILLKSLSDNQRPLNFFWIMGVFESPYDSGCYPHDLLLAAGESQRQYYEKFGVPPERIASVGLSRYEHLAQFRRDYSPAQSLAYLNIDPQFQHYFLYDSQAALRGYTTCQEQSLVTRALLTFAREHPAVALMIKPHPSHRPGWLEALVAYFSLPNVFLIDKNMLPYHALNAADLLITKLSTIALEAMLFSKPVVAILLDGEARFKIYGEAVASADDLETLTQILTMLVSDPGRRAVWVADQLKHQGIFLKNYFGNEFADSAELGAEAIIKFLKKHELPRVVEAQNR